MLLKLLACRQSLDIFSSYYDIKWIISLTDSKELPVLFFHLYNDGAIGISVPFLMWIGDWVIPHPPLQDRDRNPVKGIFFATIDFCF